MTNRFPDGATPYKFDASIPLHHQIYLQLRREIADGLWTGRTDFPGEREVADTFGASVITARSALDRLNTEGWIQRQRGRRPRVLHELTESSVVEQPDLVPVGNTPRYDYEVLFADVRIAPAPACSAFDLEPGSELWQCSRMRSHGGRPHSVTHNAQRPEVGALHTRADLERYSMTRLLGRQGLPIVAMRRRMSIGLAPMTATSALGLTVADRVLTITFTLWDDSDEILQWVRIYMHPDVPTPEETMKFTTGTWAASERM